MTVKWQVLSSTPILKDRWIDLRADRCLTASGAEIAPYYVLTYPDWVHVVAITTDDRLVLVRQYRHGAGEAVLELPGGVMDPADADAAAAARRELLEETGFAAGTIEPVSCLFANPAIQSNRVHIMLATGLDQRGAQSLDRGEDGLTVELVPVADAVAGLAGGLIGQSMHVSGVVLALQKLGRLKLA